MGTGSHRPQFEAAKGKPDEFGGIKHVRSLKSHTKLKYRDPIHSPGLVNFIENEESESRSNEDAGKLKKTLGSSDSDSVEDSDLEEMQRELSRLKRRNALRQQKLKHSKTNDESHSSITTWRNDSVFKKRKKTRAKSNFADKYVR